MLLCSQQVTYYPHLLEQGSVDVNLGLLDWLDCHHGAAVIAGSHEHLPVHRVGKRRARLPDHALCPEARLCER